MINIVGDICFTDGFFDVGIGIGSKMVKGMNPFHHIVFNPDDVYIGNFEGVCSSVSNKKGIYKKQFIITPDYLKHIHHFDFYNLANNHTMQHGIEAFNNTLSNIEKFGSKVFGTLEQKSIRFFYKNNNIGLLSFSLRHENFSNTPQYWYLPELSDIRHELNKIVDCDLKIAYIHWGNEFINKPYYDQKIFAHSLIEMGFDLIVGLHPHVLQGYELYNGKYIFYSIGNFLFNMPNKEAHFSVWLNIDFDDNKKLLIDYSCIRIDKFGFPELVNSNDIPYKYNFEYLNSLLVKDCSNEDYYKLLFKNIKKYRCKNILSIIKSFPKYKVDILFDLLTDFFKRRL